MVINAISRVNILGSSHESSLSLSLSLKSWFQCLVKCGRNKHFDSSCAGCVTARACTVSRAYAWRLTMASCKVGKVWHLQCFINVRGSASLNLTLAWSLIRAHSILHTSSWTVSKHMLALLPVSSYAVCSRTHTMPRALKGFDCLWFRCMCRTSVAQGSQHQLFIKEMHTPGW